MNFFQQLNIESTPQILLISCIFLFQFINKRKEITTELKTEDKSFADSLFWKYIIIFQLAKACDWCLGPFSHDLLSDYHGLDLALIGKLSAVYYSTNLLFGPTIVGYLNDHKNKRLPCLVFTLSLALSCFVRLFKSNLSLLIFSQICGGLSHGLLYTSFESWFINEVDKKVKDKNVKDYLFTSTFEKSIITDAFTAIFISYIGGLVRRYFGITAPFILSIILCILAFILIYLLLSNDDSGIKEQSKENEDE